MHTWPFLCGRHSSIFTTTGHSVFHHPRWKQQTHSAFHPWIWGEIDRGMLQVHVLEFGNKAPSYFFIRMMVKRPVQTNCSVVSS